ncbi:MAG: helix-turn-helix domain-containing protein [Cellulosilyticum sp.]|nr:helix-turn-helix domain-containing protein [Cellulosilyticum sp.]
MKKELRTTFNNRQYMLSKNFEIYYYSDMNLRNIGNHHHNYYEFYFLLGGSVSINIAGTDYPLSSGDMILIPPNTLHCMNILDQSIPYQRVVFWITESYCDELVKEFPEYGYLMRHVVDSKRYIHHYDVISFNTLQSKAFQLIEEIHANHFGKVAKISLCVHDLMLHLNRTVYEMEHPSVPRETQSLYENLISYIEGHLDEDLSLERLAHEFFVSKYHISHVFKENMGLSIYQYILKKRLSMCREAITTNTKISEAYLQCGFKDYSSFYRAFKKEYGLSPSEYQELYAHKLSVFHDK